MMGVEIGMMGPLDDEYDNWDDRDDGSANEHVRDVLMLSPDDDDDDDEDEDKAAAAVPAMERARPVNESRDEGVNEGADVVDEEVEDKELTMSLQLEGGSLRVRCILSESR